MKKIIVVIAAVIISFAAKAQFYAGGSVNALFNDNTTISIAPEVGYNINDIFSVGVGLVFGSAEDIYSAFGINPYVRWNFAQNAPVNFFLDGGLAYLNYNNKVVDKSYSCFQIGIKPGFAIPVNDKFSFVAHVGFLGYTANEDGVPGYDDGFGISLNGNDISCGFYYNF